MAKKTIKTPAQAIHSYIKMFHEGGFLTPTKPEEMSDLGEVNDTNIARNLKFPNATTTTNKTNTFDPKGLADPAASIMNTTGNIISQSGIDDRGFQDPTKAGVGAVMKGAGTGLKAGLATSNPFVGLGVGAAAIGLGIYQDTKAAKAANKQRAQDMSNYFASLPTDNSANPYKKRNGGFLKNGGNKYKTSEGKAIDDAYFESLKDMQYGKYIEDPIKRKEQIKNVFWNMLDNKFDPNEIEANMRNMGAYGSQRGGMAAASNIWGWDSKDINQKDLISYYEEYHNINKDKDSLDTRFLKDSKKDFSKNLLEDGKPIKFNNGGDKSVNNFNGASHENGGIKLTEDAEVEGGETSYKDYVFSDTLKVPGKNITFAQATKRLESKYKGRENDPYVMRAKEQALTQYMQQNEMVKAMEEAKQAHQQQLQEIQMKFGGIKKLKPGGPKSPGLFAEATMDEDNSFTEYNVGEGSLPDMYKLSYLPKNEQLPNLNYGPETGKNKPENDPYRIGNYSQKDLSLITEEDTTDNTIPTSNKKKSKIGNEEIALGLSMLPGLYNTVKGWKPDVTNFQNMTPHLVNLESERENLRREAGKARLIANENVRNIGGGSGTALAALASQSSAINDSKMKGLSDSYQREHLANVSTLNDFLVRNNAINNEEIVANEQNKAMSDSVKSLALADLSNNAQSYMRDKSLTKENRRINDLKLNIINQLFPNYEWGKDPNKDAQMSILFRDAMGGIGIGGLGLLGENGNTTTTVTTNTKTGAKTTRTTTTPKSKKK